MTHPAASGTTGAPASQQLMRRQNLALVLGTVARHGPLSRADVAARTGLTRPAVSSLVDNLVDAGTLTEIHSPPTGRVGRPGRALSLSDRGPAGLGLEIGVTHLSACVTDLRGNIRVWHQADQDNAGRGPGEVLADVAGLAHRAEAEAAALGLRVQGRVLAVPGSVGAQPGGRPGMIEHAPNLGWHHVTTADHWPGGGSAPQVENEANLGALAELHSDPASGTFVHISAAAGIGAALVINGRLFAGTSGFAGELGHVPVHPGGPPCACGARGCLEQYAGQAAVLRTAGLSPAPGDPVTALAASARAGDRGTLRALRRAGSAIGVALTAAVNLIDPAALVLGGGYAELADWLLPPIRAELAARVRVRPWSGQALRASALGRRGPVLGAALLTVRGVIADPARL